GKPGRDVWGPGGEPGARSTQEIDFGADYDGSGLAAIGPNSYERYFLPRGFIMAYAETLGTGQSTRCPTLGDWQENAAMAAVVDWLNGRARAYDADGTLVEAYWTTGNTGMMGVSYPGSLAIQGAITGVDGLKAIVPIA